MFSTNQHVALKLSMVSTLRIHPLMDVTFDLISSAQKCYHHAITRTFQTDGAHKRCCGLHENMPSFSAFHLIPPDTGIWRIPL